MLAEILDCLQKFLREERARVLGSKVRIRARQVFEWCRDNIRNFSVTWPSFSSILLEIMCSDDEDVSTYCFKTRKGTVILMNSELVEKLKIADVKKLSDCVWSKGKITLCL